MAPPAPDAGSTAHQPTRTAPTLTDGVVTIRGHRPEDAEGSYEQCQDPLSQRWTTVPLPYSREMSEEFVTTTMPGGWADDSEWAFAIEVDGRYGGTISLSNEGDHRAEIAYGAHPWIRGQGYVERAVRLMLTWGFEQRDLATVVWWANVGNWASRRLAWRLGFGFEGTVRRWLPQRGELLDGWVGTLLRDEPMQPRSAWLDAPVLDGRGVRLRPLRTADVDRVHEGCRDPETQRWLGQLPAPYTRADAETYVASRTDQLAAGTGATWAVADPLDDRLLGTVGFFGLVPGVECEIGYWTHPDARGRRVTTAALRRATAYAVETLGVQRVTAFSAVDNVASRRVIEAAGFRQYGVARRGAWVRDGRADLALYDVLADEWTAAGS